MREPHKDKERTIESILVRALNTTPKDQMQRGIPYCTLLYCVLAIRLHSLSIVSLSLFSYLMKLAGSNEWLMHSMASQREL